MNKTAKAMVFDGPGKPLRSANFPLPTLAAGEALVQVSCSTLCGSDVGTFFGRRAAPTPTILGHEIMGFIEGLAEVDPPRDFRGGALVVGDRVTWTVAANCRTCFFLKMVCHRNVKTFLNMVTREFLTVTLLVAGLPNIVISRQGP